MHKYLLFALILIGCASNPAKCPIVGQRLGFGPVERWHACDKDDKPTHKSYSYFDRKKGKMVILKVEELKW